MATGGFEWDEKKNKQNIEKHGVRFEIAQYAFADANIRCRLLARREKNI